MRRAVLPTLLAAALLAGCNSASSSGGGAAAVASAGASSQPAAVPGAPRGDALAAQIAGKSLSGTAANGEPMCSYYAPDGTMTRSIGGGAASTGTWSIDGAALCSTVDGVTGCDQVDLLPTGGVTLTNLQGSGASSATIAAGNQCG